MTLHAIDASVDNVSSYESFCISISRTRSSATERHLAFVQATFFMNSTTLTESNEFDVVQPLRWPVDLKSLSAIQKFLAGFPLIGWDWRVHKLHCAQLKARDGSCLKLWGNRIEHLRLLCFLNPIIVEYGRWPNSFFIPDDPLDILFVEAELDVLTAIHHMNREIPAINEIFLDSLDSTLLDFINKILNAGWTGADPCQK